MMSPRIFIIMTMMILFFPLMAAEEEIVVGKKGDAFVLYKQKDSDTFYFVSGERRFSLDAIPRAQFTSDLKRFQGDLMLTFPKDYSRYQRAISEVIEKHMDGKMRFYPPDELVLLKKGLELQQQLVPKDQDSDCFGKDVAIDPQQAQGHVQFLDVKFDTKTDQLLKERIVKAKLAEDGFFDLGEVKGIRVSWDTLNDNFGHGLYHAINGTKMYDEKPWFEGDDRGLTFGTAEGGTVIYDKGELTAKHYSRAYTRIAPQARTYKINGREYTSYFNRDEQGRYYQEMLNVDGLLVELKRDISAKKLYFKVAGTVEKVSGSGVASTLQKSWHALDKENTIQYHNVPAAVDQIYVTAEGAMGRTYERPINNWLGVKGTIEGRGGVSSEIKDQSFVSIDAEIAVNSNSWKRDNDDKKGLPPAVEATLYAGQKRYFNGERYDRVGVRVQGNVLVSDSDVIGIYAGVGTEDDPRSREMGSYEIKTRGRVDVTHFYGISWTHYY